VLPGPVPPLRRIAGVPSPEIDVRDISIQVQLLAFPQIGVAVVVGVGGENFSSKVLRTVAQALEILQSSVQHGRPMGMILTSLLSFFQTSKKHLNIQQLIDVRRLFRPQLTFGRNFFKGGELADLNPFSTVSQDI